jgi:hypothetical protein
MPRITCPECKSTIMLDQRACPNCGCNLYWSRLLLRSALMIILAAACMVVDCFFSQGWYHELSLQVFVGAAFVFGSAGLIVGCIALTGSAFSHVRFMRTRRSSGQHPTT